jgi:alpha-glucosidase
MNHVVFKFSALVFTSMVVFGCAKQTEFALNEQVLLHVDPSGGLLLEIDGNETFSSPGDFTLRRFDSLAESSLGMWRFNREEEEEVVFSELLSVDAQHGVAVLQYGASNGALANLTVKTEGDSVAFSFTTQASFDSIALRVDCDSEGSFHGFGEQYNATEQTGEAFSLFVSEQGIGRDDSSWFFSGNSHTTYFPMPWYLDARGFGVLMETDYRVEADICARRSEQAELEVVGDSRLEWRVFLGPTPRDVIRQLGDHVGRPTAPPDWAFLPWMCTQGGPEAVLARLAAMRAADIPVGTLWIQDWTGERENSGGGYGVQYQWKADETLYPDLAGFVATLHADDLHVVGYVNPFVDPALDHWAEMEAAGMLPLDAETGEVATFVGPRGTMTTADLSNPATRDYIRGYLTKAVSEIGLDGWMADFGEWLPIDAELEEGDAPAVHNRYPELWQSITRDVMEELRPDGDWLMFARSGWTGVQSEAQVHWIGDQEADWSETDGLPTVVSAMLNLGLSGQPFATHDIAGFSGGPSTKELYQRWTELGAFSPFMRTHDGNDRENNHRWDSDEATTKHFSRMARIHEALSDERIALAAEAATTGLPLVRHLLLEYPDDAETWRIHDQYLLGPDLLVAPVLTESATSRSLYLPEGRWFHVWSGQAYNGPGWVEVSAPIGEPPVFSRASDRTDLRAIE